MDAPEQDGLVRAIRGCAPHHLQWHVATRRSGKNRRASRRSAGIRGCLPLEGGRHGSGENGARNPHAVHGEAQGRTTPETSKPTLIKGTARIRRFQLRMMPLLAGLGDWHHRITTNSPEAQRYFDQGLRLTYALQSRGSGAIVRAGGAARSGLRDVLLGHCVRARAEHQPAHGRQDRPRALEASRNAARLKSATTAGERALIDAMAVRYGEPAGASRAARDAAYASAMRTVAQRFPADADAQVLFADAMLNLRPWNQWTRDGRAAAGHDELVGALSSDVAREPNHAGACHFYIHAVEASETPSARCRAPSACRA